MLPIFWLLPIIVIAYLSIEECGGLNSGWIWVIRNDQSLHYQSLDSLSIIYYDSNFDIFSYHCYVCVLSRWFHDQRSDQIMRIEILVFPSLCRYFLFLFWFCWVSKKSRNDRTEQNRAKSVLCDRLVFTACTRLAWITGNIFPLLINPL